MTCMTSLVALYAIKNINIVSPLIIDRLFPFSCKLIKNFIPVLSQDLTTENMC